MISAFGFSFQEFDALIAVAVFLGVLEVWGGGVRPFFEMVARDVRGEKKFKAEGDVSRAVPGAGARVVSQRWEGFRRVEYAFATAVDGIVYKFEGVPTEFTNMSARYFYPRDLTVAGPFPGEAIWMFDYHEWKKDMMRVDSEKLSGQSVGEQNEEFERLMEVLAGEERAEVAEKSQPDATLSYQRAQDRLADNIGKANRSMTKDRRE
jgi:hypothetical protein